VITPLKLEGATGSTVAPIADQVTQLLPPRSFGVFRENGEGLLQDVRSSLSLRIWACEPFH